MPGEHRHRPRVGSATRRGGSRAGDVGARRQRLRPVGPYAEDELDELERQRAERRARILGEHDDLTARGAADAVMG